MRMSVLRRALKHRQAAAESASKDPRRDPDNRARAQLRAEVYEEILDLITIGGDKYSLNPDAD